MPVLFGRVAGIIEVVRRSSMGVLLSPRNLMALPSPPVRPCMADYDTDDYYGAGGATGKKEGGTGAKPRKRAAGAGSKPKRAGGAKGRGSKAGGKPRGKGSQPKKGAGRK